MWPQPLTLTYEPGGGVGQLEVFEMFGHSDNIRGVQDHRHHRGGAGDAPQQALHRRACNIGSEGREERRMPLATETGKKDGCME